MIVVWNALRVVAMLSAVAGLAFAVVVLLWYGRARLLSPARVWHVLFVLTGWILCEVFMFFEVLDSWHRPTIYFRTPLCLASNLFVMLGLEALYRRARALARSWEKQSEKHE